MGKSIQRCRAALVFLFLAAAAPARLQAHDIPASAVVHVFLKPDGQRLQVMLRVPLVAMRDLRFPTPDNVYLDLAALDPMLGEAVAMWIVPALTVFEGDRAV